MTDTSRSIRVFISSTFRDMQADRAELVKRIFPNLRKMCEERGVTWGEVDLRWGVTDEQKADGKVLPICLAEIRNCRPYFIGLLGERYGWVPESFEPPDLTNQEPWLKEHTNASVTELEILHGVLNDPGMADRSMFYFRNPSYVKSLPVGQRGDFLELPTEEEIARYGPEEASRRAGDRKQKLRRLKERIKAQKLPWKEYANPRDLGMLVLADFRHIIDDLYPAAFVPDPLDRELAEHESFARSRFQAYVGRADYLDTLRRHVERDDPPLVVLGASGSGKSALLASFYARAGRQTDNILIHFIGSSSQSTDWVAMLRRILGEFKRKFALNLDIPSDPDEIRMAFPRWMQVVSSRGRMVLILDALNQLEDRDGAQDLAWLPPVIPGNIRLILSTLPGKPLEDLKKRGWPTMEVRPLLTNEKEELIIRYLDQYRKTLSPDVLKMITAQPQTDNPLFLRTLLEELRLHGEHSTLKEYILHYLNSNDLSDLFQKVLARYEADFEQDWPHLVRDSLSHIWASRRGMSESELKDLAGKVPDAYWSPFFLNVGMSLSQHSGLLNFFHDYLRNAVHSRYLQSPAIRKRVHLRLARYFTESSLRKIDESLWQYARARSWKDLYALLSDLETLDKAWQTNRHDVAAYWAEIEKHTKLRRRGAYKAVLRQPSKYWKYLDTIAELFLDTGLWKEAAGLADHQIRHHRRRRDYAGEARAIVTYALMAIHGPGRKKAQTLLSEAIRVTRRAGLEEMLAEALGVRAEALVSEDPETALKCLDEADEISRRIHNDRQLTDSLHNRAFILHNRGRLDEAIGLYTEVEKICTRLGILDDVQTARGNRAWILFDRGELDQALAIFTENEDAYRSWGDLEGVRFTLGCRAMVLFEEGETATAGDLLRESERLSRELQFDEWLQFVLGYQGMIAVESGNLKNGLRLLRRSVRLAESTGELDYYPFFASSLANVLMWQRKYREARKLLISAERACRRHQYTLNLAYVLAHKGLLHVRMGERKLAENALNEAENSSRALGYLDGLGRALAAKAALKARFKEDIPQAEVIAQEAVDLARKHRMMMLEKAVRKTVAEAGIVLEELH